MSDSFEILAIGLALALVFSLPFGFVAFLRYMRYKENVALAERGMVRNEPARNNGVNNTLRWGIILTALGLALSCSTLTGLLLFAVTSGSSGPGLVLLIVPLMFLVLLPLFFGLAFLVINRLNRQASVEPPDDPIPPQKM